MASNVIDSEGETVDDAGIGQRFVLGDLGHPEFGVVRADRVIPIPRTLSSGAASLADLCVWAVSALHLGEYTAAATVAVVGLGIVGSSAALVADAMGSRVLPLDPDPGRADVASKLGLGRIVQSGAVDATERIAEFLGSARPDLTIETSGAWRGFRQAIALARGYTRIAAHGIYRDSPAANLGADIFGDAFGFPSNVHYQRPRIIGCGSVPETTDEPTRRMATRSRNFAYVLEQTGRGLLPLEGLVRSRLRPRATGAALARMAAGRRSQMGVVLAW